MCRAWQLRQWLEDGSVVAVVVARLGPAVMARVSGAPLLHGVVRRWNVPTHYRARLDDALSDVLAAVNDPSWSRYVVCTISFESRITAGLLWCGDVPGDMGLLARAE